ncbi:phenylalanine--tRNA ligase subunit alpha [Patescibacteria group bacterium]|nr:phenylalanine--tRNA ligase subunit alpha [Patescibacteria group bacterium]
MGEQIKQILEQAKQVIASCADELALQLLESRFVGRKSQLAGLMGSLGQLSPEERKTAGILLNQAKQEITELIEKKRAELDAIKQNMAISRDVTLPGTKPQIGHLSPLTYINRELIDIFKELGFEVAEGPEVETEKNNFDLLNIPANHPARDQWDTFWLKHVKDAEDNTLLRTHTSPVQIRYMQNHQPPIRIIAPGRAYRYEAEDATHSAVFSQIEGLMIDKDISVAHLKATMLHFVHRILGEKHSIRLRPSFFPFTEPSFEVDVSCGLCVGKGCKSCSHKGWLELMGAGMVHPQVLHNVGIDPEIYSGFAFGAGIERLTMLKYGITDIRLFLSGDMRFIKQF